VPGFATTKGESKKEASKKEAKKEVGKPVDLNNASQKEIESLKGIGPAKAKKIIANRPYKSAEDLTKAGLSKKDIDKIKSQVTFGAAAMPASKAETKAMTAPAAKAAEKAAPAKAEKSAKEAKKEQKSKLAPGQKININSASQADLELLPEIGPVKAKAIIEGRPYSKPEDVMKVKGIKQKTFDKIKDSIVVR
jgi:competence protein ComEA